MSLTCHLPFMFLSISIAYVNQCFHFRGSRVTGDRAKATGPKDNAQMGPCTPIQIGTEMALGTSRVPGPGLLLGTHTTSARLIPQEPMELVLALVLRQVHQPQLHKHIWAHSTKKPRLSHSGNLGPANMRWPILEDHGLSPPSKTG